MDWHVQTVRDDDEWTREYVRDVLSSRPSYVPPKQLRLGDTTATWFEGEHGVAVIRTAGGTPDDRVVAESYLREWLRSAGYTQAQFTFSRLNKVANWDDIMAKAARLIRSGNVQLLRNGAQNIIGHVVGDHGEYQTELSREDPNSQTLTQWQCECPWDQFAWQRTRQWKKYEGRPCAHVLATFWESQRAPLDEEYDPAAAGGITPGGQGTLFDPGTAPGGAPRPGAPAPQPQPAPVPQLSIPGVSVPPPQPQAPAPDILPPYPGNPLAPTPVSVPGNNPGGPQNPVQWPGGTFSKVAEWDFSDQAEGGWKFVYSTRDGRGVVGGPETFHLNLAMDAGLYDWHGGTVSPNGLLNVYSWPGKPAQGPDITSFGPDRYPPRLIQWLQEQLPVQIHVPTTPEEAQAGIDFGAKIAAFASSNTLPEWLQAPWRPGVPGKGFIDEHGEKHEWDALNSETYHAEVAEALGVQVVTPYELDPEGNRYELDADEWNFTAAFENSDMVRLAATEQWHFADATGRFQNSDMVRLEADEYGIMEGKSEEHGAGLHKLIPKGSIGEVLGEDPTTGWVDVAFAGPQAQAGPMEPYHVRAWIEPGNLTPMPGIKKPGPFIKRR